jgi:hypothetical protein
MPKVAHDKRKSVEVTTRGGNNGKRKKINKVEVIVTTHPELTQMLFTIANVSNETVAAVTLYTIFTF